MKRSTLSRAQWHYQDSRGVWQIGIMERYLDHGGTDHTAFMERDTGELDLISGSRLKSMRVAREHFEAERNGDA